MLGVWMVVLTVLLAIGMRSQGYALSWDGSSTTSMSPKERCSWEM